ncbi:P-loop containing nucleoside triphosphate hydrolase protein [Heliocybe sulcata]|uniref:P-loop containing nucleoside triphosphate hydrolase protein n=1 Tax=Heliocybe sulcata TaxID=5364 RepID=A0A5C3N373_9AGAM|nr:P-loop containing nucleoside triphosphate hydrolase protein [Heliocybe sulcata]
MPGKRRATDVSGSEGEGDHSPQSTPAKRAKRDEGHVPAGRKSKDHAQQEASDDEEVKEEDVERMFEEEHEEAIRALVQKKSRHQGGVAEMGIIESLEMHQFMCHKYLTFSFGPQINFIIGHNGSGKSAVLSAVTVALGGKATSTGRGSGLKSFIREGQSVSEVSISLKNQGEEAYKPESYGKSIVVTRRFTKEGSSSYKIKSKDGRVVSTKREELAAICDHMNIQVDNPMNVLTQDSARQFLSAANPNDKYKFFLKGTQLQQLSDEYDTCFENISQTAKVLQSKKDGMSDLRQAYKEASDRFKEAEQARKKKQEADELKKELAWAHVASKETEMKKKMEEVAKMQRRLPKLQAELDATEASFRAASEQVGILESQYAELGDIEDLQKRKADLGEKIKANKKKIFDLKAQEKEMNDQINRTSKHIEECGKSIEEETKKLEAQTKFKRDEIEQKIQAAREDLHNAEEQLKDVRVQIQEKNIELRNIAQSGDEGDTARSKAQVEVHKAQEALSRARSEEDNSLGAYGRDMKRVLQEIKGAKWYGNKPVGPLGVHVKVKEPEKWAEVLRTQLGGSMSSFAVTDARDRPQLKRILDQTGSGMINILISEFDLFDYSSGEPPVDILTVLRALEIDDEYVLRLLVNQQSIERTVLAENREIGNNVLKNLRGNGVAWTRDRYNVRRYADGGGQSIPLQELPAADRRQALFTNRSSADNIAYYEGLLRDAERKYHDVIDGLKQTRAAHTECKRVLQDLSNRDASLYKIVSQKKLEVGNLQNEINDDLPTTISALQSARDEAVVERENIKTQYANLLKQRAEVDEAQKPLIAEQNDVKKKIDDFNERRNGIKGEIDEAVIKRLEAQKNKQHYQKKLDDDQAKVNAVQEEAEELQKVFEDWTAKAEEYCNRFENPREVAEVQRDLDSVQAALKQREKKQGATVEEITMQLNRHKSALDNAERDLKQMTALNKALKASLVIRLAKWHEFRRHIALRCKVVFQYHLSNRGYYGKVLFDHSAGTLALKVQTDDQAGTQARDKDPRSLSGGEKSFSTICLLLSLWEAIGCPIRCLDEFDVFMDAVNRRISMKMMIDTANSSDGKQYILITPQDMNNVAVTNTVRVHRMSDPERGQGVLSFS